MKPRLAFTSFVLIVLAMMPVALAQRFPLRSQLDEVVGAVATVAASREETLLDIARRFDVGQEEILLANPSVDRWLPEDGSRVSLPTAYILPRTPRTGLVLNVPEMRLYFYPPRVPNERAIVHTFPVSIGRMDWSTPLGHTQVVSKTENPAWRPPESIIAERLSNGEPPPQTIPPGPDNPLGRFALRLGLPGYLIHSTNKPYGVGMRVTHGCIRMYPEDIEVLYPQVPIGTRVIILNEPIKVGWLGNDLYVEVHPPLDEERGAWNAKARARELLRLEAQKRPLVLDHAALRKAIASEDGIPTVIGRAKATATNAGP